MLYMNKNVYMQVEFLLQNYPLDKKIVENYEEQARAIEDSFSSPLARLNDGPSPVGLKSDPTLRKVERLEEMGEEVGDSIENVSAIEDVLDILPPEDRKLIELYYFGNYTRDAVCEKLGIGKDSYYKKRNRAIYKFSRRMRLN